MVPESRAPWLPAPRWALRSASTRESASAWPARAGDWAGRVFRHWTSRVPVRRRPGPRPPTRQLDRAVACGARSARAWPSAPTIAQSRPTRVRKADVRPSRLMTNGRCPGRGGAPMVWTSRMDRRSSNQSGGASTLRRDAGRRRSRQHCLLGGPSTIFGSPEGPAAESEAGPPECRRPRPNAVSRARNRNLSPLSPATPGCPDRAGIARCPK